MNRKSSSGLFLMEMIVAVFFFMLCASTCILAFARSDHMSRLAKDSNNAVSAAQSVVEIWKAENIEGLQARMKLHPYGTGTPQTLYGIYWDRDWNPLGEEAEKQGTAVYYGSFQLSGGYGELEQGKVTIGYYTDLMRSSSPGEPLFELEASRYVPGEQE